MESVEVEQPDGSVIVYPVSRDDNVDFLKVTLTLATSSLKISVQTVWLTCGKSNDNAIMTAFVFILFYLFVYDLFV